MTTLKRNKEIVIIGLIWIFGLFLRCYRQSYLLGFYYDQGRDAKMAADILTGRNFPAIGPTTGISGLYLGPFWFYLITPGYFFAQGNPAVASFFIAFLESLTIPLIYYLVKKYYRQDTAYIAAFLWSFSHYLIRSSRWFSNPSPLPTFVLLSMILVLKIFKDKKYQYLPFLALVLGLSLQLEAASAIFFFPIILVFALLHFGVFKRIQFKYWIQSAFAFGALLLPQLAFEIKNHFLITRNLLGFLTGKVNSDTGRSWAVPTFSFLTNRFVAYYQNFFSKLDTNVTFWSLAFLVIFVLGLVYLFAKVKKTHFLKLELLWLLLPLFLLLFFVGNYGNLYDYYLTGFFPGFIILFAVVISLPSNRIFYGFLIFISLVYFLNGNFIPLKNYLSAGVDGPQNITYGNEIAAVDFICIQNAQKQGNFDVYVPPVIAHSYEYLLSWRQSHGRCGQFDSNRNSNVYIIYEVDPPHPERLQNWLSKYQKDKLIKELDFGGVHTLVLVRHQ